MSGPEAFVILAVLIGLAMGAILVLRILMALGKRLRLENERLRLANEAERRRQQSTP